jgi:GH25 family lysozyme M1 (1,4-beta-N-acetylmuramidase)
MALQPFDCVIDVSDNNPAIDWPAARRDGVRIAFVKIMQGPETSYPSGPRQLAAAHAADVIAIPYAFVPGVADPAAYAFEFAARSGLGPGMRFMLDWEGRASQTCPARVAEAIGAALAAIAGDKPIGYWGLPGATPALPSAAMAGWYRFIPRYPRPASRWPALPSAVVANPLRWWGEDGNLPRFAQYTAVGQVAGIRGAVDRSVIFAETLEAALAWARGAMPQAVGATPKPAAAAADDSEAAAEALNRAELSTLAVPG